MHIMIARKRFYKVPRKIGFTGFWFVKNNLDSNNSSCDLKPWLFALKVVLV